MAGGALTLRWVRWRLESTFLLSHRIQGCGDQSLKEIPREKLCRRERGLAGLRW